MTRSTPSLLLPLAVSPWLVLAACSSGDDGSPALAALTTGEAAQLVIGQPDFTSGEDNRGGGPAANTIHFPWGNPAIVDGRLYLPDYGNNRVLGFGAVPAANGAAADFVLGQADMSASAEGRSATKFHRPEAVASSAGKLVLVDTSNHRLLVWNTPPISTNVPADVVVGKATMTSEIDSGACDAATTDQIEGAHAASGKLIVSDSGNNRVLVWNAIPTSSGQPADLVLGQPDFTTCTPDTGGLSAASMHYPEGVWSDGTRLLVADVDNRRILLWTTFPTANGEPADVVLGQPDFASDGEAVSAAGLTWAPSVTSNGTQIAVADCDGNRVLVWNRFPTANGASADVVLGQPDFASSAPGLSATRMSCPGGVLLHEDLLLVGEWENNRYLVFR